MSADYFATVELLGLVVQGLLGLAFVAAAAAFLFSRWEDRQRKQYFRTLREEALRKAECRRQKAAGNRQEQGGRHECGE